MSLAALIKTDMTTPLGVVPLWHRAQSFGAARPAVLFINRPFAPVAIAAVSAALGSDADLFWMQMPGDNAPHLSQTSLAGFAAAVAAVIAQAFPDRPVVLAGQGMGATLALAVRSPGVTRIVAVEPELEPADAWPILATFRKLSRERPPIRPLIKALYGASPDGSDAPSNISVVDGLTVPTDIVVGEEPLMPQRPVKRPPSLVGEAARDRLRSQTGVRLHVAPRAGTALLDQAPEFVGLVLREAVAAIVAAGSFDPALLIWSPLTARRVGYLGKAHEAFVEQYRRRNPSAQIIGAPDADTATIGDDSFDLLVVADLAATDLKWLGARLAPSGVLVAGLADGADPPAGLAAAGLRMDVVHRAQIHLDRFDDGAGDADRAAGRRVLIARPATQPAPARNLLRIVSYAQRMMDVRTRLPAQALRSEPTLSIAYQHAPIGRMWADTVFVLQRPAERKIELWRPFMKAVIDDRSIIVLENDDHPEVINRALGRRTNPDDLEIFRYAHAVQTSTPELAELFGRYNPNVEIFANAVFDLPPFPQRPWAPKIFYGALARGGFPAEMARSLATTLKAFPDAAFEVVGDQSVFDALPTPNKRFHPLMPYEAYLDLMAECSILLTPLEGDHYETKSDTKFLDAASRGLVTIASPTAYGATVRHGDNGMIAHGLADWAPLLAAVLSDPAASVEMAHRAWAYVRDERMFNHQIGRRRNWYAGLMARREALNAEVISRMPGLAALMAAKARS